MPGSPATAQSDEMRRDADLVMTYVDTLGELIDSVSDPMKDQLPRSVTKTAGVVSCVDDRGGLLIQLLDDSHKSVVMNGRRYFFDPARIFQAHYRALGPLHAELFPDAPPDGEPVFHVEAIHTRFRRLALASKAYADKYWSGKPWITFALDRPAVIPLLVDSGGSVLGLEVLWGCEMDGKPREKRAEYFKLFGSEAVKPNTQAAIRDEAFLDLVSTVNVIKSADTAAPRSFTEMLRALRVAVKDTVLILGAYTDMARYEELKTSLRDFGYDGILLAEHPDVPEQTNIEKMIFASMCSAFIVALDDAPSGHIAELEILLTRPFRPVILIRPKGRPSTAFLDDSIQLSTNFRIHEGGTSSRELADAIKWAREKVRGQTARLDKINSWRNP